MSENGQNGGLKLSPQVLREAIYILTLAAGGGAFYNTQATHGEKIIAVEQRGERREQRITELERKVDVITTKQTELENRLKEDRDALKAHIDHDVLLQANRR